MATGPLEIRLLGDFQIRVGERVIPEDAWKLRKAAGIIKLLALEPTHRLHREQILDALWPELDPDAAANNLRVALHAARGILNAGGMLRREDQHVMLGSLDAIWVDVHAFETAADIAWRGDDPAAFGTAARLYTGDLLPADSYEEWLDTRRAALRTSYLALLSRLARLHEGRENAAMAIETWRRVLEVEPTQEEAHVQLMLLFARAGRRQEALAQYNRLAQALRDELDIDPDPVSQELVQAIRNGQISATAPPAQESSRPIVHSNLPTPATALIGRERELAEVQQALTGSRLVTLTGPGGAGKTRLAIALAEREKQDFTDGVFFVPLAPLTDAELVETAIVQALGIQDADNRSAVETLSAYLRERSALLVLDNFEHVVAAAPLVGSLLESSPSLKILTTSRVPLRVRGEREFPLRALTDQASSTLFIERSSEVRPGFDPEDEQVATIVEICRRLDGLPLAIELAAARSRVLSPAALLERLEHPLAMLTSGPRDLPARQQTLRAAIAWSYDLLDPDVQSLFRALAVFAAGWTVEATEAVCPNGLDALDGLTVLVESNLLEQLVGDGEPRFRMLETIREYGLEQLEAAGETGDIRRRHADYYLTFAEEMAPDFRGARSAVRHVELSSHHDNLRGALTWTLEHDPDRGLRVAANLEKYWFTRGVFTEWEYWLDALVERSSDEALMYRARALHQIANVALHKGDPERAWTLAEESLKLAQEFGLDESMGRVKTIMGYIEERSGNSARAMELAEEALAHYYDSGFELAIANQLQAIASLVINAGEYERGLTLHEESLQLKRKTGDTFFLAMGLVETGVVLRYLGRIQEAAERTDEALELSRSIDATYILAYGSVGRGLIAIDEERYDVARKTLVEGAQYAAATNIINILPGMLEGFAAVFTAGGDVDLAVQVYAAADAGRRLLNVPMPAGSRAAYEHHLNACRSMLDAETWKAVWAQGELLSIDEAITLALSALEET